MWKTGSTILIFMVFSAMVALFVSGCIGPLDINRFLEGDKVQNIIDGDNDGEEEVIDPWQPLLKQGDTPIAMDEVVPIFLNIDPRSVIISVANAENFKSFLWTSNSVELGSGDSITISSNLVPFNAVADHLLTVDVEDQNGHLRSSRITIRVRLDIEHN